MTTHNSTTQHESDCIFCKIVTGAIPSRKVYEDDQVLAFHDISPAAPVHFLIVPKSHIASLEHTQPAEHQALLGHLLALAPQLAHQQGAANGFKVVINTGVDGGQEVAHLHLHVMGGAK
jgi:histidine triad (HIT) family protein